MSIEAKDVIKIAHLARLEIQPADVDGYAKDLSGIMQLVEQMNDRDTTGVEPMAHPLDQKQRLRPDQVTETDQRDYFQSIAPQTDKGLYLVPKVIE
jgi:aspartyl-tRNA(Asn)/glutamyl-tRNA(Gln) amidotransferase subunit C